MNTGCAHYHSPLDVIAILFKCCQKFYPCYQCHDSVNHHAIIPWQPEELTTEAILCRACNGLLSIQNYLQCANTCPHCRAPFNPGCQRHYHYYFIESIS